MTSATELLRRMLDERGGFRVDFDREGARRTCWKIDDEQDGYCYFDEDSFGATQLTVTRATPAQAIAATLGATDAKPTQVESSGTCHDVWNVELTGRLRFQCSECGAVSLEITPRFCPACGKKVVEPTTNDVDVEVAQWASRTS